MGPLAGVKVVEIASIGPGPFCCMMLADQGADVIRVQRPNPTSLFETGGVDVVNRGRTSVNADLKSDEGKEVVRKLVAKADALVEGFRPGVMERLGLGPDELLAINPKLVYGRMTGYGQDGPMSSVAGHDINYISLSGALGAISRKGDRPLFPLNLLGDYGGGGMLLAFGVLAAVIEARSSGEGQVVDAAMVEGAAVISTAIHGLLASGGWSTTPGTNVLDSGAHFYEVYETSDGGFISVGAIEPQFYAELLEILELDPMDFPQWNMEKWEGFKDVFAEEFKSRTRAEWVDRLEHREACATAVQGLGEASSHPHNVARGVFFERDGVTQPSPAPRFSRTAPDPMRPTPSTDEALAAWGVDL